MSSTQDENEKFEAQFQRYGNMLYRLCMVYLKNHSSAEDAMQEAFITLFHKAPKFEEQINEQRWLVRVTINICKDKLKSAWHRRMVPLDILEDVCAAPQSNEVFHIVQELPEKYRTVIYLHYVEGFSVAEIAKTLQASASAIKMRLKRGRDLLKIELKEDLIYGYK